MSDIRDLNCIDDMASHMKRALEYHVVSVVESMEATVIIGQAEYEEQQAEQFQARARQFFAQAALEKGKEEALEAKAQHYEQLAAEDLALANSTEIKIEQEETLRSEIAKNISLDQQRKHDVVEELRHINEGGCSYRVVRWLCDIVGGTVELQREADKEALQIQQDMALLQEVDRQEYAEKVVAEALQGNATKYSQTAAELFLTAQYWAAVAQHDYATAVRYNDTGNELAGLSGLLEKRGEREYEYRNEYLRLSEQEIKASVVLYKQSVHLATAAVAFALMALCGVSAKLLQHMLRICRSTYEFIGDQQTTELEFWRRVYTVALHVVILFASTGFCGTYVSRIQQYGWRERAAIVSWVSFLSAGFQTLIFQTIPHCTAECPLRRNDILSVLKYSALRLVSLFLLSAMEFLIACTTFPFMVSSSVTAWFGQPLTLALVLVLAALYLYVFEPRGATENYSTISSLVSDDASRTLSEATPLTSSEVAYSKQDLESPGSTAVALMYMNLRPEDRGEEPSSELLSMDSLSPYFWSADVEVRRLVFAFDLLMSCVLTGVLMDCLPILYRNNPARVIIPLSVSALAAVAVAIGFFLFLRTVQQREPSRKIDVGPVIEIGSVQTCCPSFSATALPSTA